MAIRYSTEHPEPCQLYDLYESLGWNTHLGLPPSALKQALDNSWLVVSAYDEQGQLIGTGRVISDEVTNAYVCGLGIVPGYQGQGIGTSILAILTEKCAGRGLHVQLLCESHLQGYYESRGFRAFAVGMRRENYAP